MTNRMPVLMAAQAVALSARTGSLRPEAVTNMVDQAITRLSPGDDLRSAVITFSEAFDRDRRDPGAMEVHGVTLETELREILKLNPASPRVRVDLDG